MRLVLLFYSIECVFYSVVSTRSTHYRVDLVHWVDTVQVETNLSQLFFYSSQLAKTLESHHYFRCVSSRQLYVFLKNLTNAIYDYSPDFKRRKHIYFYLTKNRHHRHHRHWSRYHKRRWRRWHHWARHKHWESNDFFPF